MRNALLPGLVLFLPLCSCTPAPETKAADAEGSHQGPTASSPDPFAFDIAQRTCALFVAVRSHALQDPVFFGRDVEDIEAHWNMCPGGTMVACAEAPTASGDTIRTGIPWPY